MSENSKIEWCDHTFNGWEGCTKVSPGCVHCYAENRNARWNKGNAINWGPGAPRRRTSEANWKQPLKWNREAERIEQAWRAHVKICQDRNVDPVETWTARGIAPEWHRPRVFCSSLADWLDDEVPIEWLADLLALIHATPHLDWLLLTKRPENFRPRLEMITEQIPMTGITIKEATARCMAVALLQKDGVDSCLENVWIGTTVENQDMADKRIPQLLSIPAKARFLSCEPLLGFTDIQQVGDDNLTIYWPLIGRAISDGMNEPADLLHGGIHWVICGGESGPKARPMHPKWARAIRDQCAAAGVPFLFKQWGEWLSVDQAKHVEDDLPLTKSYKGHKHPDGTLMLRVGKSKSGRILDGREHNEFPKGGAA